MTAKQVNINTQAHTQLTGSLIAATDKIPLISWSFFLKKMLTKSSPISTQSNLFHSELFSQLDVKDPLIQLANTINWK
jgi:hypothetical protein